ncbi:MAG TPA: hypothetical protein PLF23_16130, partial [Candidatus Obscuribacter sp.]|nr:hypothetical protein [Candidatus Obscuribacter sp.]
MPRKQMGRGSAREAAPLAELAKSPKIVEGEKTVSLIAEPSMSEPQSLSPEPQSLSPEPPSPSQEPPSLSLEPQSLSPEPPSSQCCPALAEVAQASEPGRQAEGQGEVRDSQSPALPAKKFLNYELLFEIQKDSISTTYAARNIDLEGFLALRIFNERISDSGQIKEIQKAAGQARDFTHANHVTVYENGISDEGTPYVVSDWLKGESLSDLNGEERQAYYMAVCKSLGLNPLTKPFEFLYLKGKLTLYARREATEQLRKINGISLQVISRELIGDVYIVTVRAVDKQGRFDESTGAVYIGPVKGQKQSGEQISNA